MRQLARVCLAALLLVAALGGTAQADGPRRRARPVQVSLPRAVVRSPARRPGVVLELGRAPVSAERAASRPTFVDRITRSVSGERF